MVTEGHGLRVTVRMPDRKGEMKKLLDVVNARGWCIQVCAGVREPKIEGNWKAVIKIQEDLPKEEVVAVLGQIEGHEILDVRET